MTQAILDLFPDSASQFGLLGCGLFVLSYVAIACLGIALDRLLSTD